MTASGPLHTLIALAVLLEIALSGCHKEVIPDPPSEITEPGGLQLRFRTVPRAIERRGLPNSGGAGNHDAGLGLSLHCRRFHCPS